MKIAFDAKRAFLNTTGLGNHNRTLLEGLFRFFPNEQYLLYSPKIKENSFYHLCKPQKNIEIHLPQGGFRYFSSIWRTYQLGKDLKKDKPDVFHGLSHELPFDIAEVKTKKVVTIHDLIFLRYPKDYSWFDQKMHLKKVDFACKQADTIIAVSEQTKRDLISFLNVSEKKIAVVYPTIAESFRVNDISVAEIAQIQEKYTLPPNFVLYVGSLTYRKNVISLIQAIEQLPKEITLMIVGKGNLQKNLSQYIENKQLSQRIKIFSTISDAELKAFYKLASLFVYPSVFEGFGLPIQEAMYSGLPIVAGNNSCFSEAGGKGGIYVNQENPAELAEAIKEVFCNDVAKNQLIIEGKLHLEQFTTQKLVRQTMQIYQS